MINNLISVIIPVFNAELHLDRCIKSIINQTYKNIEIILINDGSVDNSLKICKYYQKNDERIKVINKINEGVSTTRNLGIKVAKGNYICFVDSDDFVKSDYIQFMFQLMQDNNCEIVQCGYIQGTDNYFNDKNDSIKSIVYSNKDAICSFKLKVVPWGKLYKKEVFENVYYPPNLINEDDATYYKIAYNSNSICISNKKLYYYYESYNSITRNNDYFENLDFIKIYEERLDFFKAKNEIRLYEKSIERFCIVLLLSYSRLNRKNPLTKKLFVYFKEYFGKTIGSKNINILMKCVFITFRLFPNSFSYIIKKMKKY